MQNATHLAEKSAGAGRSSLLFDRPLRLDHQALGLGLGTCGPGRVIAGSDPQFRSWSASLRALSVVPVGLGKEETPDRCTNE